MSTCSDCNWFGTRESHCSKHHKKVKPGDPSCDDFWQIVRPIPEMFEPEEMPPAKACSDCLKYYDEFNFKFCPVCGKELKK